MCMAPAWICLLACFKAQNTTQFSSTMCHLMITSGLHALSAPIPLSPNISDLNSYQESSGEHVKIQTIFSPKVLILCFLPFSFSWEFNRLFFLRYENFPKPWKCSFLVCVRGGTSICVSQGACGCVWGKLKLALCYPLGPGEQWEEGSSLASWWPEPRTLKASSEWTFPLLFTWV